MCKAAAYYQKVTQELGLDKMSVICGNMVKSVDESDAQHMNKTLYLQYYRLMSLELGIARKELEKLKIKYEITTRPPVQQ